MHVVVAAVSERISYFIFFTRKAVDSAVRLCIIFRNNVYLQINNQMLKSSQRDFFGGVPPGLVRSATCRRRPRLYSSQLTNGCCGDGISIPYPSHTHRKSCGYPHRIPTPTEPQNPTYPYPHPVFSLQKAYFNLLFVTLTVGYYMMYVLCESVCD